MLLWDIWICVSHIMESKYSEKNKDSFLSTESGLLAHYQDSVYQNHIVESDL